MDEIGFILYGLAWLALLPYVLWNVIQPRRRTLDGLWRSVRISIPILLVFGLIAGILTPNINYGGGGPSTTDMIRIFLPPVAIGGLLAFPIVSAFSRKWVPLQGLKFSLAGALWGSFLYLPAIVGYIIDPLSR